MNPDEPRAKKGKIFVISAPSGAGKSTLCRAVLQHFADIRYSVSYTTREPRGREINGVHYHYISKEDFLNGIEENRWAEWALVHDNYYGTSARILEESVASGCDIILDIDVQGAAQIVRRYPEVVTIFIMPPSPDALKTRMEARGTDSPDVIAKRLKNAVAEMARKEHYRHVIVNDDLNEAVRQLILLIQNYRI
jgi:guanylate kinase